MRKRAANSSCVSPSARRIIFARGMRFMRLKSSGVSGFASGSASAAAITSASVIVRNGSRLLPVFLEVVVLLIFGCSSGADNTHPLPALGVGHKDQGALDHADQGETLLAIGLAVVDLANAAGIGKCHAGALKRDAMPDKIPRGLVVVPFELGILHQYIAYQ